MSFEETKWILFTRTKEHKYEVKLWEHYIGGGDFKMDNGNNNNIYYKDENHVTKMETFKCI